MAFFPYESPHKLHYSKLLNFTAYKYLQNAIKLLNSTAYEGFTRPASSCIQLLNFSPRTKGDKIDSRAELVSNVDAVVFGLGGGIFSHLFWGAFLYSTLGPMAF